MLNQRRAALPTTNLLGLILLIASSAMAQLPAAPGSPAAAAPPPPSASQQIDKIEVRAATANEEARAAMTSKSMVTKEEIAKFGARSLTETLRRIPGVSVVDFPGKDSEVRMRGIGSGYVQFLINGAPTAPGFSIDSISPVTIERIEIVPVGTVDQSAQGIAGTINIITRAPSASAQRSMKVTLSGQPYRLYGAIDGQYGAKLGAFDFGLNASVAYAPAINQYHNDLVDRNAAQTITRIATLDANEDINAATLTLAPRLSGKLNAADSISADAMITLTRRNFIVANARQTSFGAAQLYPNDHIDGEIDALDTRNRLSWSRKLNETATIDSRVGFNVSRRTQKTVWNAFNDANETVLDSRTTGNATDTGINAASKYRTQIAKDHNATIGFDLDFAKRSETRIQRDTAPIGYPAINRDDIFASTVSRAGLFAQDEWDIASHWSLYAGLRAEAIRTATSGETLTPVRNSFSVLSPILQSAYKFDGGAKEQLRIALNRTFKAPTASELIPRRWTNADNNATAPVFQGNPQLRPELALGMDVSYERALSAFGNLRASIGYRRIDDVILKQIEFVNAEYLQTPFNGGRAAVFTYSLDTDLNLRKLNAGLSNTDLRLSLALNRSQVDAISGPYNRLDSQVPYAITFGLDHRFDQAGALSAGMSFNYQGGALYQLNPFLLNRRYASQVLDMYVNWKLSPSVNLRLAANDLIHRPRQYDFTFEDARGSLYKYGRVEAFSKFRLIADIRL